MTDRRLMDIANSKLIRPKGQLCEHFTDGCSGKRIAQEILFYFMNSMFAYLKTENLKVAFGSKNS